MARTMYDAVNPANLPTDGDLYAGYMDGHYANVPQIRARFPGRRVVAIAVQAHHDADVLDVERGDAQPIEAPAWVRRQRSLGKVPTVYCSWSAYVEVRGAFIQQGVAEPQWWIARYNNDPTLLPWMVAKQYGGNVAGGYDVSSVADHWPGVDPGVTPMHQPAIIVRPVVADCACPTGGAWTLGDDGSVDAWGGAPYEGGPNGKPYWAGRKPAVIRVSLVPGKVYDVVDTSGETYSYPE